MWAVAEWRMEIQRQFDGAAPGSLTPSTPALTPRQSLLGLFQPRGALLAAVSMLAVSVLAVVMRPQPRDASLPPTIVLETAVPRSFGGWRELPSATIQVVNPQTQELLDKLYSQTLSRTYVNQQGYRIMLSLAYGDDQRGGLQAHMPEVCYPAQGFALASVTEHPLATRWGVIPAKRVVTNLGQRHEPITYWFALGDKAVQSGWDKRMVAIRFGLTGQVPDGILFRISSIDANTEAAFSQQQLFADAVLGALTVEHRARLTGLPGSPAP